MSVQNNHSGARLHTESLRVGITPQRVTGRTPSQKQLEAAARFERESSMCRVCGKTALYRVFTLKGVNLGACAAHRDRVRGMSPLFHG